MTSSPRLNPNAVQTPLKERKWLYQTPEQILTKASNGASDFGNKYGQPLICGSLTFEHQENDKIFGYDKESACRRRRMANKRDSLKERLKPEKSCGNGWRQLPDRNGRRCRVFS